MNKPKLVVFGLGILLVAIGLAGMISMGALA